MMSEKNSSFPLMPLLILVGIFYLNFISRIVMAPLLPVIEAELGLGHGEAGSLFFFVAAGYGIGLLGSGFISSRLTHRHSITLSIIAVGASMLLISRSASLGEIHAGLTLIGIFGGVYLPSGLATLTGLVRKEQWGKAMAIHELAPNLGFITAPLLSEFLLKWYSWRESVGILGGLSILMGILYLFIGKGGKDRGEPPRLRSMRQIVRTPSFWIMTTLFTVSIGSSIGVYTMMPLYLVSELGMERGVANTIIGLSRTFGILVLFTSGIIIDRAGPKQAMGVFLTATGIFTLLLGLIRGPLATPVLVFLQAAAVACLFPVGFTIISLIFPTPLRGVALSMVIFIGFLLGGGAIPSAIGHWAEAFSFSSGFTVLGLFFLGLLPIFLRTVNRLNFPP